MAKPGRNDPCSCGSGKKYKRCCESKTPDRRSSMFLMIAVGGAVVAAAVVVLASLTGARSSSPTRVWDPVHGHYHNANGVHVP